MQINREYGVKSERNAYTVVVRHLPLEVDVDIRTRAPSREAAIAAVSALFGIAGDPDYRVLASEWL